MEKVPSSHQSTFLPVSPSPGCRLAFFALRAVWTQRVKETPASAPSPVLSLTLWCASYINAMEVVKTYFNPHSSQTTIRNTTTTNETNHKDNRSNNHGVRAVALPSFLWDFCPEFGMTSITFSLEFYLSNQSNRDVLSLLIYDFGTFAR